MREAGHTLCDPVDRKCAELANLQGKSGVAARAWPKGVTADGDGVPSRGEANVLGHTTEWHSLNGRTVTQ